jgi:hypothetical protein
MPEQKTDLDATVERLRELAKAATPGPWTAEPYVYADEDGRGRVTSPSDSDDFNLVDSLAAADAKYIAAVSPDVVLELLDALEDAESKLAALRDLLDTPTDKRGITWWEWIDGGLGGMLYQDMRRILNEGND